MSEQEIARQVMQLDTEHALNLAFIMGGYQCPTVFVGWSQIIADMCSRIYRVSPFAELVIRANWGELRVTAKISGTHERELCRRAIDRAVAQSRRRCEGCGSTNQSLVDIGEPSAAYPCIMRFCVDCARLFGAL